jgi:hypothetical protein
MLEHDGIFREAGDELTNIDVVTTILDRDVLELSQEPLDASNEAGRCYRCLVVNALLLNVASDTMFWYAIMPW